VHERFGFAIGTPGVSMRLASIRTDGTDYQEVPGINPSTLYNPTWSRDGRRIAFVTYDGSRPNGRQYTVWVCNADGTGLREIDEGLKPDWSANGDQLAYVFQQVALTPGTPPGFTSWSGLAALNVVTGQGVFAPTNRTDTATGIGVTAPVAGIDGPRWGGDAMVWASFSSSGPSSPSTYALKRYLGMPGTIYLARDIPAQPDPGDMGFIRLADFSPTGDLGLVNEGYMQSSETRVSWLSPQGTLTTLKRRTSTGGGAFSPDGQRLWINLDDGRGTRFVTRTLDDAGAPGPLPMAQGGGYSWFTTA